MSISTSSRRMRGSSPWPMALYGGLLGAALASLAHRCLGPIPLEPSEWLAFLGALIGVALTVFGAIFVEDRSARKAEIEDISLLAGAIKHLKETLETIGEDEEITEDNLPRNKLLAKCLMDRFSEATAVLDYARANSRLRSADQVLAVHRIEEGVALGLSTLQKEEGWINHNEPTAPVLRIFFGKVEELSEELIPRLEAGISSLG